ncbi:MAG: hypothetical protein KBG15_16825 [Kofleriaceae bacterium]|nr:hypothetical protein [Kofleriaceae bacterium]
MTGALVLSLFGLGAGGFCAALAHADGINVLAETGLEFDSNVTLATANADPVAAMVLRAAGSAAGRFAHGRHRFNFDLVGRLRAALDPTLASEVVGLGSVDLRWLYQPGDAGEGRVGVGAHGSLTDARGLAGVLGARTFRNANAEGLVTLQHNAHRFIVAVGGRDFRYRPNPLQSYRGGAATTALESRLWQSNDLESALTLTVTAGYELRRFDAKAQTSLCPPTMLRPECVRDTTVARHDQVMRAGVELTYVGAFIVGGSYRILDIVSSSFGHSLRRHQLSVAATRALSAKLFATVGATAQLDEFSAGAKLVVDPLNPEISTLADEARSVVQLRLGYRVGPRWTLEGRAATWTNLASDVAYHRRTLGVTLVRE